MKESFNPKSAAKQRRPLPKLCRPNGENEGPVYVVVNGKMKGTATETRELVAGQVFADFDKRGNLLGVEVVR